MISGYKSSGNENSHESSRVTKGAIGTMMVIDLAKEVILCCFS
jgi:hypothetical protein